MPELQNKFSELHRRVSMTSKARYCASRRLQFHKMMSQWTVTLIAVGLIAVSVLAISPVTLRFSLPYVAVMQIIFSVLILAYTLLLSLGDYSARAVKIHRCGMELGKIARELKPYLEKQDDQGAYEKFVEKYYECLEKYENHETCDYFEAFLAEQGSVGETGNAEGLVAKFWTYVQYLWSRYVPTAHYVIVLGLVYLWIFLLVK
ncbi:MAG: SLATT domain-containing protein [Nitrospirales bacterium]